MTESPDLLMISRRSVFYVLETGCMRWMDLEGVLMDDHELGCECGNHERDSFSMLV